MAEWYRVAFGELYPVVYPHRDIAEAARVASKLAPLLRSGRPTLDVACGNGRYMNALDAAGVDVYGVDLSEYLLGEAVKNGLHGRVVCGDMRGLPFGAGAFGSAINMFTSFGYFDDDADNALALREIARVVDTNGRFALDFINAAQARQRIEPRSERATAGAVVMESREISVDGRLLSKRVEVRWPGREPVEYSEHLRLYSYRELAAMLSDAGFEVRHVYGDYELGAFDESVSQRLLFVCGKRMVNE